MEKKEPSYVFGRNVNWCSHCGKQYRGSSKNKKIMLPYDPILRSWTYTQTKMYFKKMHAVLCSEQHYSPLPRHGNNLKCPSTDERINKMWYIYTMKYYSLLPVYAIKKNDIMPFAATWMDLRDFHTK